MQLQATVMARNLMDGPTVISSDIHGTHSVEFQGHGDADGNDVQIIPEELIRTPQFTRAVHRGILAIDNPEDNPELLEAMERQTAAWHRRQKESTDSASSALDETPQNDIISMPCVGPNSRGSGACPNSVTVRAKDQYDVVPLCSAHENLRDQYVKTEDEMVPVDENRQERKVSWSRVRVTARNDI